jgi:hypothetical protein
LPSPGCNGLCCIPSGGTCAPPTLTPCCNGTCVNSRCP